MARCPAPQTLRVAAVLEERAGDRAGFLELCDHST